MERIERPKTPANGGESSKQVEVVRGVGFAP
jgi:hypothetical protein